VPAKWTLENALPIVRAMDPIVRRCNFSLAFRGSVLIQGESDNDLDLCFLHERSPRRDAGTSGACRGAFSCRTIPRRIPAHQHRNSCRSGA
jgi:hypothetical protein